MLRIELRFEAGFLLTNLSKPEIQLHLPFIPKDQKCCQNNSYEDTKNMRKLGVLWQLSKIIYYFSSSFSCCSKSFLWYVLLARSTNWSVVSTKNFGSFVTAQNKPTATVRMMPTIILAMNLRDSVILFLIFLDFFMFFVMQIIIPKTPSEGGLQMRH